MIFAFSCRREAPTEVAKQLHATLVDAPAMLIGSRLVFLNHEIADWQPVSKRDRAEICLAVRVIIEELDKHFLALPANDLADTTGIWMLAFWMKHNKASLLKHLFLLFK